MSYPGASRHYGSGSHSKHSGAQSHSSQLPANMLTTIQDWMKEGPSLERIQQLKNWVQQGGLQNLSKSKMRRFYEVVATHRERSKYRWSQKNLQHIKNELTKITVLLSYDIGRASNNDKVILRQLQQAIDTAIQHVHDLQSLSNLFDFMEALIAFHYEVAKD